MCKGSGSEAVQAVPENEGADTEAGAPRRNQRRYAQQAQAEVGGMCVCKKDGLHACCVELYLSA